MKIIDERKMQKNNKKNTHTHKDRKEGTEAIVKG